MTFDRRLADRTIEVIDGRVRRLVAELVPRSTWGTVASVEGRTCTVYVEGATVSSPGYRWYGERPLAGDTVLIRIGPLTGRRIIEAIDRVTDHGVLISDGWLTAQQTRVPLGTIPAGSFIDGSILHCTVGFDSSGTDAVTIGTDADPDAILTSQSVAAPVSLFAGGLGVGVGYQESDVDAVAFYVAGGTAPTVGQAYVVVRWWRVESAP